MESKVNELKINIELNLNGKQNLQFVVDVDREQMLAYLVQYFCNKRYLSEEQSENVEFWFKGIKLNPFTNFTDYPEIHNESQLLIKLKNKDLMNKVVAPK